MLNPFVKNFKAFSIYLVSWIFISLLHGTILYFVLDLTIYQCFVDSLVFNTIYFALGLGLWYSTKYISFETYSTFRVVANHITAATITSAIWILIGYWLLNNILENSIKYTNFLFYSIVWRFFIGMMFYIILVTIMYTIIYYENFKEKALKEAELKSLVKEAELKSLKYQINPHFIFNSLNSISALTISKPELAQEMTIKLSNFLRKTLSVNDTHKSKLEDELKSAKLYLDIEKVRFGEKLLYEEDINDECKKLEVPNMIFQPIFENAVKHGVYESIEPVTIKFTCGKFNEYLKITISNDYDNEAIPHKGEGIGLKNIQNRLKMIYNQENLLSFKKDEKIFTATILIPINE